MSEITFKKMPGVLSFQRGFVISDGLFFNQFPDGTESPVNVIRHGIRGTQNINNDSKADVSNIQITETAKTDGAARGVKVGFGLRVLPLADTLFACAGDESKEIRAALDGFIEKARSSEGLQEVARRYARNILNGRWLWRNRILGAEINTSVSSQDKLVATSDALLTSLNHFDSYTEDERKLGQIIAEAMIGSSPCALEVEAVIDFGFAGAIELFPSQNYVENKPSGFARPLYKLGHPDPVRKNGDGSSKAMDLNDTRRMGVAALRDQKIGNALRTIDTWYPAWQEHGKPIPVEPNGASLDAQAFFRRDGGDKKFSAFELMKRINLLDPNSTDGMFLIASLMRGGVFSESEKKPTKGKEGAGDEA